MRTIEQIKADIVSTKDNLADVQDKAHVELLVWLADKLSKTMKAQFTAHDLEALKASKADEDTIKSATAANEALRNVAKAGGLLETRKGKGGGYFVTKMGFKSSGVSPDAIEAASIRLANLEAELVAAESVPETEEARQQRLFLAMAAKMGLKDKAEALLKNS